MARYQNHIEKRERYIGESNSPRPQQTTVERWIEAKNPFLILEKSLPRIPEAKPWFEPTGGRHGGSLLEKSAAFFKRAACLLLFLLCLKSRNFTLKHPLPNTSPELVAFFLCVPLRSPIRAISMFGA